MREKDEAVQVDGKFALASLTRSEKDVLLAVLSQLVAPPPVAPGALLVQKSLLYWYKSTAQDTVVFVDRLAPPPRR